MEPGPRAMSVRDGRIGTVGSPGQTGRFMLLSLHDALDQNGGSSLKPPPPWPPPGRRRSRRPSHRHRLWPPARATGRTGRPRVVGLLAATLAALAAAAAAATLAAALAAAEAAATAATLGLGDLGRRAAKARTDLVHLHLDHGALLAFLGLVAAGLQPALGDHRGATGERLGDVLRRLAPHRAAHEQRLAVLPLVRLAVERARASTRS